MGYREALEAAGAKVLAFKEFGSYQGDWYALVEYNNETGWVHGCYGSCSGCDSFEAEFGYSSAESAGIDMYDDNTREWRKSTQDDVNAYTERLVSFGKTYLDGMFSQSAAEKYAAINSDWDHEAENALKFLKEHAFDTQVQ